MRLSLVCICACAGFLINAFADNAADEVLAKATTFYKAQQYDSTIAVVRAYLKEHGSDAATERVVPLLMEAMVRGGNTRYFDKLFSIYEKKFPASDYMPRLHYLNGIILSREEKYSDAIVAFSNSLHSGAREPLDSLALRNSKLLCAKAMSARELGKLTARPGLDRRAGEVIAYYEFSKLHKTGRIDLARRKAEAFRKKYPGSPFGPFAKAVIGQSRTAQKKQIPIGLLAPVSGYDADVGKQVVQAVQLAVAQHNSAGGQKVRLIIGDTEGKTVRTAELTRTMINEHEVPVIIGPILSANAAVSAAMLIEKEIVMVTPTATDDGIARLGANIFQCNVTAGMLGRRIAAYAHTNLHINEFAIMSPLSDYGRILSESFKKEVARNNGTIVAEEFFDEGTKDFRQQFKSLREKLMLLRYKDVSIDEMELGAAKSRRQRRADSLYQADSLMRVGGLFLPAESEDVVMLAPQVHFHRIQTQLLGSTGWHSSTTLLDGKRYVNDAVISTSFETDLNSEQWVNFFDAYKARFTMQPDRVVAPLAYDAARLVLNAVSSCDDDSKAISRMLLEVDKYHGVSGYISFKGTDGANSETAIMKLKNKQFIRLQ